ncbi:hypothetical protein ACFE04_010692 [Oxalis oulophora]
MGKMSEEYYFPVCDYKPQDRRTINKECWKLFRQAHPNKPEFEEIPTTDQMRAAQSQFLDLVMKRHILQYLGNVKLRDALIDYVKQKVLDLRKSGYRKIAERLSRELAAMSLQGEEHSGGNQTGISTPPAKRARTRGPRMFN